MTKRFGDRATFCVEVGEITPPALRVVDLWAAGTRLTCDDNTVVLPSFLHYMGKEADEVRRGEVKPCPFPGRTPEEIHQLLLADETGFRQQFWFMQWSETVDNVILYACRDGGDLVIVSTFWWTTHPFPDELGKIFVARIPPDESATIIEEAVDHLDAEFVRQ